MGECGECGCVSEALRSTGVRSGTGIIFHQMQRFVEQSRIRPEVVNLSSLHNVFLQRRLHLQTDRAKSYCSLSLCFRQQLTLI